MPKAARQRPPTEAELVDELGPLRERLTPRQRAFVAALEAEGTSRGWGTARRAAEAAGYACPERQGPRLRTMPKVAAVLARLEAIWGLQREERWRRERDERVRQMLAKPPAGRRRGRRRQDGRS